MSIPADSAVRSAARDSSAALEKPKSDATSRPLSSAALPNAAGVSKSNLTNSIQALKESASKSGTNFAIPAPSGLTGEPLSTAYEKRIQTLQE